MPMDLASILPKIEERAKLRSSGERWIEEISKEPRAFVYHNFLTNEECEHLINLAKPGMVRPNTKIRSTVAAAFSFFPYNGHDKIVKEIEKRISDFTFMPIENGQGLCVLHYEVGQKSKPHYDYSPDIFTIGGPKIATFLMYLSDVEEGGETHFPLAKGSELSKCGKRGLTVLPKKRDALLFLSMRPDGSLDPSSIHAGCQVIKGNKWACTKLFHLHEYNNPNFSLTSTLRNRLPNTIKRSTGKIESSIMKKTKKQTKDKEVLVETEKKRRTINCTKCGQGGHNSRTCDKRRAKHDHGEALTNPMSQVLDA